MDYPISIQTPDGVLSMSISTGDSVVFVGANGSGKTRLTAYMERHIGANAHRIAAHRALSIDTSVAKVSEKEALTSLRFGASWDNIQIGHREQSRWSQKPEVILLSDSVYVVQALFATHANAAVRMLASLRGGASNAPPATHLEKLQRIWEALLPHRTLELTADDVLVKVSGETAAQPYGIGNASDGERSLFYLIGQALLAQRESVLIIDEPELHVHRSVIAKLWDAIEAERPDCAFIYVTHDLDFAASRRGRKFVLRSYTEQPMPAWMIEEVPKDSGFPEDLATLILGSRRPVLFVEGAVTGLDSALYNAVYDGWTIVPCGSCQDVIHSVNTMRAHSALTRLRCAGIVDADDVGDEEVARLRNMGVHVLPVSEIENIFALPSVARILLAADHFDPSEVELRIAGLRDDVFAMAREPDSVGRAVRTYLLRHVDSTVKQMGVGARGTLEDIELAFEPVRTLDLAGLAASRKALIEGAIASSDLTTLLSVFSDKRILQRAAVRLRGNRVDAFEGWLSRLLRSPQSSGVLDALRAVLPSVPLDAADRRRAQE